MAAGIHALGAVSLAAALRGGRISAVAATEHYLARIAQHDPALGAFTFVDEAGARAAAKASAGHLDSSKARPLEGVPIAIKANLDVAGWPVNGGLGALRDRRPERDSAAVARLRAAGAVLLGLTNLHEGALGATTINPFYGTTRNPHDPVRTAGGSSGGSAAAVAAGLCAAAIGTDTLGSIRIPASYCGIAGLKPGHGLVSMEGMIPLAARFDTIGPLARSVEDCGLVLAALAPHASALPISRVATLGGSEGVDQVPAVRAAMRLTADLLRGLGLDVSERAARIDHGRVRVAAFLECAVAARQQFGDLAARDPEGFSPAFRSALHLAAGLDAAALAQGRRTLDAAAAEIEALLALDGAILLPATPQAAFPLADPAPLNQADFTALANLAGLPALALPAGWTVDGLPVGVQLVGRRGSEAALIDLGSRLESALNAGRLPANFA